MTQRLAQLKALSLHEWRLLLTSMLLLPLTALSLHLFGFKRIHTFLSRFVRVERGTKDQKLNNLQDANIVARMVSVAANHGIYRANCLKQSLVLWWLLQRRGIPAEIQIGVNRDGTEAINAHAWVECGGVALAESSDTIDSYQSFFN